MTLQARKSSLSAMAPLFKQGLPVLLVGTWFGILLIKSQVAEWERIHRMFLMREIQMHLIIGIAIATASISIILIRRFQIRSATGKQYQYQPKPFQPGVIIGGFLFGMGWAITGACPGPIYAQIGSGQWLALLTLAGAMTGMFLFAFLKPILPGSQS